MASPISFEILVTRVRDAPVTYLAAAGAPPLREVLAASVSVGARSEADGPSGGLLVVGPEGDFTDEEVAALVEAGARPVGLGPLRLRVETAAVAIVSRGDDAPRGNAAGVLTNDARARGGAERVS